MKINLLLKVKVIVVKRVVITMMIIFTGSRLSAFAFARLELQSFPSFSSQSVFCEVYHVVSFSVS